jgi:hypothetical protein
VFLVRNTEARFLGRKLWAQALRHEPSKTLQRPRPAPWMHRRLSGQLPRGERDCLLSALTKFWLSVECDRGLNYAECAAGAVLLEETNFKTMESKVVPVSIRLTRSASVMPGGWLQLSMSPCREFWLVVKFPQLCVQTVRVAVEHPISLNGASARNLGFLDREEEIIYP